MDLLEQDTTLDSLGFDNRLSQQAGPWFEGVTKLETQYENEFLSTCSSGSNSPSHFGSLFDTSRQYASLHSDADTLFTNSNTVSLTNSPALVKSEMTDMDCLPDFSPLPLPMSLVFAEDDDDVCKDRAVTKVSTQLRRKRAPRKRLTPHQKEAHNKIEKRYRININTKIAKLQQIIPWVASEETAFEVGDSLKSRKSLSTAPGEAMINAPKLNKSMILEKAVDYILYLQNNERLHEMELQRLREELEELKSSGSVCKDVSHTPESDG